MLDTELDVIGDVEMLVELLSVDFVDIGAVVELVGAEVDAAVVVVDTGDDLVELGDPTEIEEKPEGKVFVEGVVPEEVGLEEAGVETAVVLLVNIELDGEVIPELEVLVDFADADEDMVDDVGEDTAVDAEDAEDAEVIDAMVELELTLFWVVDDDIADDTTEEIDMVDMEMEELELGGGEFVYRFSLSEPPQNSVLFPLQSFGS